jgi:predicted transcriptional regulator
MPMRVPPSPTNVVDFKLPKRPKVVEKEAPPDKRSVAVLPIRALTDKQLTDGTFRALALLCSYCNRAGITWVSQKRLADDMKVSRQAITKHLTKLKAAGYVEVTRKGFRGERANTLRVVFDPSMTAQDAIAITSSIEDTRPPEQAKREEELRNIMADNDLPDLTPEQIQANMRRLKTLLGTLGQPSNFRTHQPQSMGAIMATTKAVKTTKKGTRSAQPKVAHNSQEADAHRQPNTVANEEGLHRQPESVNNTLHRQPHRQPNRVALNTEKQVSSRYIEVFKKKGFNCLSNQVEIELLSECMTVEEATEVLDLVAARYQAEGLSLPSNLPTVVEDMIATHAARHLEGSQRLS